MALCFYIPIVKKLFPEMENYHILFIFNFSYNLEQITNK
jgi:hypothetical protein